MTKLLKHLVLICGILSPFAALFLYGLVYGTLTSYSTDLEKDWLFRLSISTLAMTVPFLITLVLAIREGRRHSLFLSGKIGLIVATLSLALAWKPVNDGILRSRQIKNLAMHDVAAPAFVTPDISGKTQNLGDHKGEVVIVNIWATWCGPCRAEMPKLNQLYQDRKPQGLTVFGISDESVDVQQKFLEKVPVTYPLLTLNGNVPNLYRDIAKYPAIFLIDRQGRLQPAPGPDEPFENLKAAVDVLLKSAP
ncbi:MAG TPA: TlpA disulfide reductase family protein [Terriglobales bacterium]|jgi:peroxiredoxin|nr:TlpA disulfide reductase family protein [Terriglobales bacterium]